MINRIIHYNECGIVKIHREDKIHGLGRGSRKFSDPVFHHTRWKLDWGSTTFSLLGIEFCVELDKITVLNYNIQLPKIFSLIQQWNRRIHPR